MATEAKAPATTDQHRNEVRLVGELATDPQGRTLPSGDEVVTFRLTVRTEAPPGSQSRAPTGARSDSVDCAAWTASLRARVQRYSIGDLIEVGGPLRHRYWRGPGGIASRYEVEARQIRVLARAAGGVGRAS